jgi:aminocarboxymuconate-semialdehyde decarboxylase
MTRHAVVDVHAHVVPPSLPDRIREKAGSLPSVQLSETADGRPLIALPRSAELGAARPPIPGLLDLELAVSRMDQQGIDTAIISIWPDLLGSLLPPAESVVWATCVNDALMEVAEGQDRFRALATIPLQSDHAAAEVERAKNVGFVGVEIGTRALGHELDSPHLDQFWEALVHFQMPVFIHPLFYGGDTRLADNKPYGLANSIGRVNDTTIAISRLLLSGVPVRYPGLEIVVAHGGGAIPYLLGRLGNVHDLNPEYADPYDGFTHLHFDSIVFDPKTLEYLVARAGGKNVLLGSDHPFANGDPEPTKIVSRADLDEETRNLVLGGNARRVFRI